MLFPLNVLPNVLPNVFACECNWKSEAETNGIDSLLPPNLLGYSAFSILSPLLVLILLEKTNPFVIMELSLVFIGAVLLYKLVTDILDEYIGERVDERMTRKMAKLVRSTGGSIQTIRDADVDILKKIDPSHYNDRKEENLSRKLPDEEDNRETSTEKTISYNKKVE
jgi:ABC-type multidrug transport system fused ATPase/permease subunit